MQPKAFSLPPDLSLSEFKHRALAWAAALCPLAYYDNNEYDQNSYSRYELLLGAGAKASLVVEVQEGAAWAALEAFRAEHIGQWCLGGLSYELKNELENLESKKADKRKFPLLYFFVPQHLISIPADKKDCVEIWAARPEEIWAELLAQEPLQGADPTSPPLLQAGMSKTDYLQKVNRVIEHIVEGDLYEMNLCQEFFAQGQSIDPLPLFVRLNTLSPAPFAAYCRFGQEHYLLCASPERFMYKTGHKLVSQPIKGTIRRGIDEAEDEQLKEMLSQSEKDRAENVMIVDLLRNDLARVCSIGTVEVEELFGIYSFRQVFQMISTISGLLPQVEEQEAQKQSIEAIKAAFPMGSMTGAPKVISMQLIEDYENNQRGLYSGAVGYFNPQGDFDFNVVIRSIFYQVSSQYLSFQVGGAIVYDSVPEQEYEECLLKAKAILAALGVDKL